MRRFAVPILVAVPVLILAAQPNAVFAQNDPDPVLSTVPKILTMTPNGTFAITMTIVGPMGPVVGVPVVIDISAAAEPLIVWPTPLPSGADPPTFVPGGGVTFSKITGPAGTVTFNLAGSGCVADMNPPSPVSPWIARVVAGGIVMKECLINNPDAVDLGGQLPEFLGHDICAPYGLPGIQGISETGLADALYHTPQVRQGTPNSCSDFTSPYGDPINLGDAIIFTPYIKAGISCTCITTF